MNKKNPYIKVTLWIGLVLRAKTVSIYQNPQDGRWFFEIEDLDMKDEDNKVGVYPLEELRAVELIKE